MRFSLKGAVAVLTGAASGIGAALARILAERGVSLALADRNEAALLEVAEACRKLGVPVSHHVLDVSDPAALDAFRAEVLKEHGQVDILINNAGVALMGTFEQSSLDDFAWLMGINFWAPVRLTHAFLPDLRARPAAHIVNVSSIFGIIAPPGNSAYCASKFALRGFSEALRHELEGSTVTLTVVHPGGVRTQIASSARVSARIAAADAANAKRQFNALLKTSPEEAAAAIAEAIAARSPRLLIGRDARLAERIQRLFPVTYWKIVGRRQPVATPADSHTTSAD